jgi:hypothetical protein
MSHAPRAQREERAKKALEEGRVQGGEKRQQEAWKILIIG